MTDNRPTSDQDIIDQADDLPTPSHSGSSGGSLAQEVGARDEDKVALGGDPQPTAVRKGDKPDGGDAPNLPNRDGGGKGSEARVPPRRTS